LKKLKILFILIYIFILFYIIFFFFYIFYIFLYIFYIFLIYYFLIYYNFLYLSLKKKKITGSNEDVINKVKTELQNNNFSCYDTTIGGNGVAVHQFNDDYINKEEANLLESIFITNKKKN